MIVTGAGSGIGRAAALAFAAEGANVTVADVDDQHGWATVAQLRELGAQAEFVRVDVSLAADCAAMVEHAVNRYGRLDIAFNNAGINIAVAPIADVEDAQWERIVGVNGGAHCAIGLSGATVSPKKSFVTAGPTVAKSDHDPIPRRPRARARQPKAGHFRCTHT